MAGPMFSGHGKPEWAAGGVAFAWHCCRDLSALVSGRDGFRSLGLLRHPETSALSNWGISSRPISGRNVVLELGEQYVPPPGKGLPAWSQLKAPLFAVGILPTIKNNW